MNFSSMNRTRAIAIIVAVLMITSISAMALPVQAQTTSHGGSPGGGYEGPTTIPAGQTADFTIHPIAFLSVSPATIGLGQEALVNVWITFPSGEGKYMVGYTVTITKPDGSNDTVNLKSYVADGTSYFTYVPTSIGTYSLIFNFPGEYFPAGYYVSGQYSTNRTGQFARAIFNPSDYVAPATSQVRTLTVQNEIVASWHSALPSDYWTRPIEPNNREWSAIAGNYPFSESLEGDVQSEESWTDEYAGPFITAPNTPHIVWKNKVNIAGIIGGEAGNYPALSNPGTPSVIYQGRCYQTMTVTINGVATSCAVCYDLQTGKQYYANPVAQGGVTPTHIAYWVPNAVGPSGTVPGEAADLGLTVDLLTISGTRLYKINPTTGAVTTNVSLPSDLGTGTGGGVEMFYRDGYFLSFKSVNSSLIFPAENITVTRSVTGFLVNWTAQGSSTNFTSRIASNITVTMPQSLRTLYQTGGYGDLGAYDPDTGITVIQSRFIYGGFYGSNFWAVNLVTGQTIWNITTPVEVSEDAYRPTNAWCRHGRYVAEMERGYWQAWDLNTGKLLWTTSTGIDASMGDYPWGEFYQYDEAAYNDVLYSVQYTGVFAVNETNGVVLWHYVDPAPPFETPYNSANGTIPCYSMSSIRIADNKIYVMNSEHSPSLPATRGWGLTCLDLSGKKLWKISGTQMRAGPSSDGYMMSSSSYDGTQFALGKGQSQTTVTVANKNPAKGGQVLIEGTVMDMSPASPNTPCIADQYMDTWMDYLHLQMPVDGYYHNITVTGVPVLLVATDSNGSTTTVGTTTTGVSGSFQMAWTPPNESVYRITAIFSGTNSYGGSTAETGLAVGPAPTTTPTTTPGQPTPADYTTLLYGILVAVVVAIIIGLVAIVLVLRRH